jgi:cell volume regulation protein A
MSDVEHFALLVLVVGLAITAAVLFNQISERIRIPAPAIVLVAAAVASDVVPALGELSVTTVQRIVSVALVVILFDGGMHIGWRRFRTAAGAVTWVGVVGTFVTAAALAVLAHALFDLDWRAALLGSALAPTDPAVVFSVLGRREVAGRSGTILEGESGVNDPVGIALLASLLTAGPAAGLDASGGIAVEFLLQLAVGAVVGMAGGALLVRFMRRVPLPSEGLYPLRVLAGALVIYGAATVTHGSGFLAVFIAGILAGDARAPYKGEIERFHGALASLAEIVAFLVLGLAVGLHRLPDVGGLWIGLALAVLLTWWSARCWSACCWSRCGWHGGSGCSCCGPGSRAPCPSCSAASCSPPRFPTPPGCMPSSWSWWPSRSSSRAAWSRRWPPT